MPSAAWATAVLGTDMTLNGSAAASGSNLQLTSTTLWQAGSAWRTSTVDTTRSFTTTFSFALNGTATQADGISFAMQNVGVTALGRNAAWLGVGQLASHVNVTIQTWTNNKIGFGNNAISTKAAPNAMGSCSSIVGTFTVAYQAAHGVLALYGTYTACGSSYTVADSLSINLQTKFGNSMYVGFTGATGGASSTQTISAWSFVSTGDLVMQHKMDGTSGVAGSASPDSSGNGFDGTFVGAATPGTSPPSFCGANEWAKFVGGARVDVPQHAALSPRPHFSVAMWVRVDGGQGSWRTPINGRNVPLTRGFNLYAGVGNQWEFWTGAGLVASPWWHTVVAGTVTVGQWVHIAATYQASSGPDAAGVYTGTGTLYVNGVAAGSNTNMLYLPSWDSSLNLGAFPDNGNPLGGALDDVRLYAKALSAAEVQALIPGKCPGGLTGAAWWSRADSLALTDNSDIATWSNDVNASKDLSGSATKPKLRNNNAQNINFNPVVEFTSTTATEAGAQFFSAASMLGTSTWNQGHYVFVAYPYNTSGRTNFFWESGLKPTGYNDGRFSMHFPWYSTIYWDAGNCCISNRVYYDPTKLVNRPSVYLAHMDTTSASMPGPAQQGIRQDGVSKATTASPIAFTGNNQPFWVGRFGIETFQGVLAEGMLFLGRQLSASDAGQLESYLGLKYGLTLGENGSSTYAYSYSGGAINWAANTGFHNNIVGVGRDDTTKLNQLISRSVNPGDQITLTTGTGMPSTASVITATTGGAAFATDGSFAIVGDNGQSATSTAGITVGAQAGRTRSARIWRLQLTGSVPTQLTICIPDTLLPGGFTAGAWATDLWLTSATAADFSTGVAAVTMTAGTCVASGVGVTNGVAGRLATLSSSALSAMGGVGYFTVTRNLLDHIEITASSSAGVTCAPTTYTVRACSDAACTTLHTHGLSGTLTLSGAGVTSQPSGGAPFTIAAGNSSTTVDAQVLSVSTATVGASGLSLTPGHTSPVWCGLGTTASATASCALTVGDAGFVFSVPNHYAGASQSLTIKAVRSSDNAQACLPAFANVTKPIKATCGYVNPSSGTLPVLLGTVKLNSSNTNAACDAVGQTVNLSFNATGEAAATLSYWDAGKARLNLAYSGSAATNDAGLSMTGGAEFIAAPMGFIVTDYPSVVTAGSTFSFNVKALAFGSNSYVTPNFGRESPSEGVTLAWLRSSPLGAEARSGTFAGTVGSFSGGVAAVTDASWSEVGRISPSASLTSHSYLGSGLTAVGNPIGVMGNPHCSALNATCTIPAGLVSSIYFGAGAKSIVKPNQSGDVPCTVAYFGDPQSGATNACYRIDTSGAANITTHIQVRPARLELSATPACGSFSYAGQPFGVTVTAKNSLGATTQNYAGAVARLVNLSDASANSFGSLSGSVPASAFALGVATLANNAATAPVFSFSHKLTAPQTISVRGTDTDGVSSNGYDANQTLRSGRLQMSNAFGGDRATLQVPLQLQYWSGKSWLKNSDDSCTVISSSSVVRAQTLTHTNAAAGWTSAVNDVSLSAGGGHVTMGAPSPNGTGTVDLSINLGSSSTDASCLSAHPSSTGAGLPWLRSRQGACASTFDRDPSARASFGVYAPESKRTVHVREVF